MLILFLNELLKACEYNILGDILGPTQTYFDASILLSMKPKKGEVSKKNVFMVWILKWIFKNEV